MSDPLTETVYVSDLDGTLLGPDARLSSFSRSVLERLIEAGVPVTVASARGIVSMQEILGDLPLRLPVVCFNGAFVSDLRTGQHLEVFDLGDTAAEAWALARSLDLDPIVSTTDGTRDDGVYVRSSHNPGVAAYVADRVRARDPRLRLVEDPGRALRHRVTCLTVIDRRERLVPWYQALEETLGERIRPHLFDDLYTEGWAWVTVHAGEATKDRAVRSVLQSAGLSNHRLVAFGDQDNDLPLLRAADHAVATANASAAVLATADETIGHHGDDAVARWLLQHVGGRLSGG